METILDVAIWSSLSYSNLYLPSQHISESKYFSLLKGSWCFYIFLANVSRAFVQGDESIHGGQSDAGFVHRNRGEEVVVVPNRQCQTLYQIVIIFVEIAQVAILFDDHDVLALQEAHVSGQFLVLGHGQFNFHVFWGFKCPGVHGTIGATGCDQAVIFGNVEAPYGCAAMSFDLVQERSGRGPYAYMRVLGNFKGM